MENNKKWYKISDIERFSGVSRRTIHFYLQSGLLHPPYKTGKTMSYYDDEHLKRLKYIKQAKADKVPLFLIKEKIKDGISGMKIDTPVLLTSSGDSKSANKMPTQAKARKTREKIIRCGYKFFCEKGFRETKVSDITKTLNVGKGTFYFYFKDKKELLLECVPLIFETLFTKGWNRIRKEKDPLKRLELRAQAVFPVISEFCAIIQLCKEAMEEDDRKLNRMGQDTFLSIREPLETDIKNGIEKGHFRKVDPKIAASMMIGIIENMYYLNKVDPSIEHESMWSSIIDILISGVKKT